MKESFLLLIGVLLGLGGGIVLNQPPPSYVGFVLIGIACFLLIISIAGQGLLYDIAFSVPALGKTTVSFKLSWWKRLLRLFTFPTMFDVSALIKVEYPDGWVCTSKAIWETGEKRITIGSICKFQLQLWNVDSNGKFLLLSDETIPEERRLLPDTFTFYIYIRDSLNRTKAKMEALYECTTSSVA